MRTSIPSGTILQNWIVGDRIGSGACSDVYTVKHRTLQHPKDYVMKVSKLPEKVQTAKFKKRKKTDEERACDALYAEHLLYQGFLQGHNGIPSIPTNAFGEAQGYRFLVIERLGRNLEEIKQAHGTISSTTAAKLAIDIISILEHLHNKKILFVDVKPENFMLNIEETQVYCVDFGISERYIKATGIHKEKKESAIQGTPTFLSLKTHNGLTPSRRDDIEATLYVLIYLMKGSLPWENAKSDKEGAQIKEKTSLSILCKGLPKVWELLLEQVRAYDFEQVPDYAGITKQLLLSRGNSIQEKVYKWSSEETSSKESKQIIKEKTRSTITKQLRTPKKYEDKKRKVIINQQHISPNINNHGEKDCPIVITSSPSLSEHPKTIRTRRNAKEAAFQAGKAVVAAAAASAAAAEAIQTVFLSDEYLSKK